MELAISIKNAHVRVLRGSREGKGQLNLNVMCIEIIILGRLDRNW